MLQRPSFVVVALAMTWGVYADSQPQRVLTSASSGLNPSSTASIKSVFTSFSGRASDAFSAPTPTPCCDAGCPVGFCNGFTLAATGTGESVAAGQSSPPSTPGAPKTTEAAVWPPLCNWRNSPTSARCVDVSLVNPRPTWPACHSEGTCSLLTEGFLPIYHIHQEPRPTATVAEHHAPSTEAATATGPPATQEVLVDPEQAVYADDLTGANQDRLPIVVEDGNKDPTSLVADVDLGLQENYISQAILTGLGLSSSSSSPILSSDRRSVSLGQGNDTFQVTPASKIALNLLAGPPADLRKFADVEFQVFDLPTAGRPAEGDWEPELFLGTRFLRSAGALKLAPEFAGQGVVEGVPVLVRKVYFVDDAGRRVDAVGNLVVQPPAARPAKDEL